MFSASYHGLTSWGSCWRGRTPHPPRAGVFLERIKNLFLFHPWIRAHTSSAGSHTPATTRPQSPGQGTDSRGHPAAWSPHFHTVQPHVCLISNSYGNPHKAQPPSPSPSASWVPGGPEQPGVSPPLGTVTDKTSSSDFSLRLITPSPPYVRTTPRAQSRHRSISVESRKEQASSEEER